LSDFEMFKTGSDLQKKSLLTSAINNINYGLNKDADKSIFGGFDQFQEMHDSILTFAGKLYENKKSQSEFFYKNLAKIYSDTTEQYVELFVPKVVEIKQDLAFKENSGPINQTDVAGNRQGLWIKKYDNGLVESEIFFKDNHPAGVFRKYYENGNLKANMYFDETGERTAAVLYNEDGSKLAMGYYYKHQKDSLWQYYINDSIVIREENYKKGVKDGYERTYNPYNYPNLIDEKYWKNGKQDSTWTKFYMDGTPKIIAVYKDGVREGKYVAFNEEGATIAIGNYKNNLKEGVWKMQNAETQEIIEIEYKNGHPVNEDELSEQETKAIEQMEQLNGKFQEPGIEVHEKYDENDN